MKLTEKARKVLQDANTRGSIGANRIADVLGFHCGQITGLRAGQYAGRLVRQGWLRRCSEYYPGRRGYSIYSNTIYYITDKGEQALLPVKPAGKPAGLTPSAR